MMDRGLEKGRKKVMGGMKGKAGYIGGLIAPKKPPFLVVTERKLE